MSKAQNKSNKKLDLEIKILAHFFVEELFLVF